MYPPSSPLFSSVLSVHLHSSNRSHASTTLISNAPSRTTLSALKMATGVHEVLPPALDSTSDPPAIFDGTTRLYISYICPYAQRAWITRNCKGLQEKIKLVPIDLQNKPTWYKEKVYPQNKVKLF
ncbi:glutathione S-transferase L3-like isoform X2 [Camellia sinensis]|uniref:glutathione S-transferase L3-like isoform X2 n=1 Tax=Camellia sinensis TaxID=4442 RepID=UPI001036ADBA|nr:glutathione S-transferase L3-like isoform X2 [Camellia sinensis]